MLHEYAISPQLLQEWASNVRDYREFIREYGLGSPRIPSTFPKQKARKLRSYFLSEGPRDQESNQARRYLEMVEHLTETTISREGVSSGQGNWNADVVDENERAPFHVVLSVQPIDTPRNLTPQTMYSGDSAWNHDRQVSVARRYDFISLLIRDMLRLATDKVVIIDSYGWNGRAISFITQVIQDVFRDRLSTCTPSLCLFYKENSSSPRADIVRARILDALSPQANSIELRVTELREMAGSDVFHNRYILTELGGVTLGHGVDVSEVENHTDEITLMSRDVYERKWNQYIDNLCFEIVSQA